ncbi:hypothetical protein VCR12J2_1010160 [Vibrio coralliirubri]|nr:hypothetical protein VCR12J2_1010160 [Vibrio coralliirubri]
MLQTSIGKKGAAIINILFLIALYEELEPYVLMREFKKQQHSSLLDLSDK